MYPPRISQLIRDLRDNEFPDNNLLVYNHHRLADYICEMYSANSTLPEYKGITAMQMSAGCYLGMNVIQIRDLFQPHTVKKDWADITVQEVITVLVNFLTSERIQWHLVTLTHMKLGSLSDKGEAHDPKYLAELSTR